MIKYLGSKRLLLPHIVAAFGELPDVHRVGDLFSGTARVGRALRAAGYEVLANDQLRFAATLARCYVAATLDEAARAEKHIAELRRTPPKKEGYFTETFCRDARYFHPKNGAKVEAIRDAIDQLDVSENVRAILLVSLMEAADRVDSTTGVQMAYLKKWAKRAHNDLELRLPELVAGKGEAREGDAIEAAARELDAVYLDPPYNQHSYLGNYHIWETLVRWDEPEPYGVARKRIDCRERKSAFNSKRKIEDAFRAVVDAVRAPYLVVSFSNEGYLARDTVVGILEPKGHVGVVPVAFSRYVGAKIGIHNPQGQKVGSVSHTENKELIFVVGPDARAVERACAAVKAVGSPLARRGQKGHMASS